MDSSSPPVRQADERRVTEAEAYRRQESGRGVGRGEGLLTLENDLEWLAVKSRLREAYNSDYSLATVIARAWHQREKPCTRI